MTSTETRTATEGTGARLPAGLAVVAEAFDELAAADPHGSAYDALVRSVMRFTIPSGARVLEIGCGAGDLLSALEPARGVGVDVSPGMIALAAARHPELELHCAAGETFELDETFDYVLLSDLVPFAEDVLAVLQHAARMTRPESRVVVHSYSQLWRPIIRLAELLRLKFHRPIRNWVSPADVCNLLGLAGFEVVSVTSRILFPRRVPLLARFLNGFVGNLWPLSNLCLTYWIVARPKPRPRPESGVSVVCPCRNEEAMIAQIVEAVPELGMGTELVFVDDGSTDGTAAEVRRQIELHPEKDVVLVQQKPGGKAAAVRAGFAHAKYELLMILDADLTVRAEELPRFYDALVGGHGELINGSRLVYGLEPGSMRFLNVVGNKLFSMVYSDLLGQPVKDTLCGTKALTRSDWRRIDRGRSYFGDFDRWGDFDLLLGAAKLNLKIVDMPIRYGPRTEGESKMARFRHGWLMLKMAIFGFLRLKTGPTND